MNEKSNGDMAESADVDMNEYLAKQIKELAAQLNALLYKAAERDIYITVAISTQELVDVNYAQVKVGPFYKQLARSLIKVPRV